LNCCETGAFFSSFPVVHLKKRIFEQLAKEIDPFIATNGKLVGVMIHTESFPGGERFGALVSHLHHRQIERIAAVTDSGPSRTDAAMS
jgi:hypothetical protein